MVCLRNEGCLIKPLFYLIFGDKLKEEQRSNEPPGAKRKEPRRAHDRVTRGTTVLQWRQTRTSSTTTCTTVPVIVRLCAVVPSYEFMRLKPFYQFFLEVLDCSLFFPSKHFSGEKFVELSLENFWDLLEHF